MSDLEIIRTVINNIDSISVPMSLTEQIAIPLTRSNNLLKQLYNAIIDKMEEEKKAKEVKAQEPELKVVPEGEGEPEFIMGEPEFVEEVPEDNSNG